MTSPTDPHTSVFSHINGPPDDILDRLAVAEICKGWPVYRDASEWKNFRSLFAPKATVWTSTSSPCVYLECVVTDGWCSLVRPVRH